ncbi:MAG: bifunctional UDP-N-acetylglucosamine diphosphorylase/glucosamine-1-phosphate N-acetyltransferase GlmU, partial [Legionellales bacterium]|nr:bifunctional UDP-N-acetylglucosamine diphosphorylase/glucosamine-1-phosphate N-acetyltransferase GlmU [Legionellales bacterium]
SSIVIGSLISQGAQIGPFAYVRAKCNIKKEAKLGAFVEAKNTTLGDGSKASHLSYLGDAEIGMGVNIGAGTITCNYDGAAKHKTKIEDNAFIGSGTELVAPLTINKGSYIGAGSCITNDTPAEKLTIARSRQVVIDKWSEKQQENDKN